MTTNAFICPWCMQNKVIIYTILANLFLVATNNLFNEVIPLHSSAK